MDNYAISRNRAQAYFLGFDQQALTETWKLSSDENFLYTEFLGRPYRICRKTGTVSRCGSDCQADFEETLSIFDFLCHEGTGKYASGRYAPVNSLKNRPRAIGVDTGFHTATAAAFDRDPEAFRLACIALGGTPVSMGDLGFRFPLFRELSVILKFYRSDEEFPASVTLLWDENTLQYIFYETVFYIAGSLLGSILDEMKQHGS